MIRDHMMLTHPNEKTVEKYKRKSKSDLFK